jgi:hypothetical protein
LLPSITIPASVESLGDFCFFDCVVLASVTFESGSRLSHIGNCPFANCALDLSICIPSPLRTVLQEYEPLFQAISPGPPLWTTVFLFVDGIVLLLFLARFCYFLYLNHH